jgi:FeS assembly ATPase SufC
VDRCPELRHTGVVEIRTSHQSAAGAAGASVPDGHTRRAIVRLLLESGSITAVEIGDRLGLAAAGVRRHLDALAMDALDIDPAFAERSVNEGFSGGEKKRHEILQLALLKPKIAILDETDSGLDIDALRVVSDGVNRYAESEDGGILLITHYTRILRYIHPQFVHVLVGGRIVESGGPELADELDQNGYERFSPASGRGPHQTAATGA